MDSGYSKQSLSDRRDFFRNSLFAFEMYEAIMNDTLLKEVQIIANEPNNFDLIEVILPFESTRMLICPNILDCTKISVRCNISDKKKLEICGYQEYCKTLYENENSIQNILKEIFCVYLILRN
jgi:hypothetical protein